MLKRISVYAVLLVMMLSVFSFAVCANEPVVDTPDMDVMVAPDMDILMAPEAAEDAAVVVTPISPVAENAQKMQFKPMAFVENLNIMGVGMLGIFIVIAAIIISVFVLNKLTSPKPEKKDE